MKYHAIEQMKTNRIMVLLLVAATTLMLLACGVASVMTPEATTTTRADIIGIWSQNIVAATSKAHGANLPDYTLKMEFNDDGTFTQTITSSTPNLSATTTGTWESSGTQIMLNGLLREGGTGNSPWRKVNTNWWMTESGLPGQRYSLYGGLWDDCDTWVEFYRISATSNASGHGNQNINNQRQTNSNNNDEQEQQ